MTIKVSATEAKATLLALLDRVETGTEIEITRHGRPVARLVPASAPHALRGMMTGVARTATDDERELFRTQVSWEVE